MSYDDTIFLSISEYERVMIDDKKRKSEAIMKDKERRKSFDHIDQGLYDDAIIEDQMETFQSVYNSLKIY